VELGLLRGQVHLRVLAHGQVFRRKSPLLLGARQKLTKVVMGRVLVLQTVDFTQGD